MTLITYEPKSFLDNFFNGSDLVPKAFSDPFFGTWAGELQVNIVEEEDKFVLTAPLPGWTEKSINVEVKNGMLTLKGQVEECKEDEKPHFRMREFNRRSFERSFRLGDHIDQEGIKAKLADGILRVVLPKKEDAKPKTVKVQVES